MERVANLNGTSRPFAGPLVSGRLLPEYFSGPKPSYSCLSDYPDIHPGADDEMRAILVARASFICALISSQSFSIP